MKEEISKVLMMVQEGKIDSEKAAELIQVLKEKEASYIAPTAYLDKTLKVRVVSKENGNVNVKLPIKLVKTVLRAGHGIAINVPQAEKYVKDLDIDLLIDAIENELDGQIVDIQSANGDTVAVIIE
ncbi:SHOCT-like domain-containing protein [Aneurinibacillus aneurinilyticus]|jgi:hypothetical protein|uniref:YvlB/LiaX N-terminal domain-containing protein n=2 Tax=Aneurinibacillus aneurinilyticus TaxID=1391 RepID=A0A848D656_ANEAE|nr:hypothetical protein [Aneurinibacillus aneurinilyticus]ERI11767.1 hypothetical protein HMPREF0083_00135 [Aneurinibacillus aneurinilyticus ATCC 12856]MCI1693803.1 hypothetical protein [Aneurinibacillus aneurinilyticus]MED0672082.1 hypothetical protein [Aneurinibacillus aneurinilyticus]MED0709181.1 hypothetical protein [Aneurinibacillus aneurinilyticus]MED0726517.1 hypothetical protein [Aneurinibacillus aneurinilyticus]